MGDRSGPNEHPRAYGHGIPGAKSQLCTTVTVISVHLCDTISVFGLWDVQGGCSTVISLCLQVDGAPHEQLCRLSALHADELGNVLRKSKVDVEDGAFKGPTHTAWAQS
jgi:hypothetical protein